MKIRLKEKETGKELQIERGKQQRKSKKKEEEEKRIKKMKKRGKGREVK